MTEMKCTCGNKECTTTLEILHGTFHIDIIIEHKDKDGTPKRESIGLDPNSIVVLIAKLKDSLRDMT